MGFFAEAGGEQDFFPLPGAVLFHGLFELHAREIELTQDGPAQRLVEPAPRDEFLQRAAQKAGILRHHRDFQIGGERQAALEGERLPTEQAQQGGFAAAVAAGDGKPVALMSKEDKVKAIRFLNDTGAFLITKSGGKVCKYFGISKYTLYSYIEEAKAKP